MTERPHFGEEGRLQKEVDKYFPTIAIHRADQKNVGDMNSRPDLYFKWLNPTKIVDIEDSNFSQIAREFENSTIVVGGGGLLFEGSFPEIYGRNFSSLYQSSRKLLVAWGIGHNNHGGENIRLPDLDMYDIAGIRGGSKYHWVPCSSCLSPILDEEYPINHDVVFFRHKFHPFPEITTDGGIPTMDNSENNINEAIRFIASGETVLTNSYHGAYWGILLGRKVVIIDPFSTKFQGLKWKVPVISASNWQSALSETRIYPEALNESREANNNFADLVRNLLATHE